MTYYILFTLFFTVHTYGNENILKIANFAYPGSYRYFQFNSSGSVILPKYKTIFTLPKGAWCIAETHKEEEKNIAWNEIWYEDATNVKKVTWDNNCIPQEKIYYNVNFYRYFFSIRTLHSLTCENLKPYINNGKKYSFNSKYIEQFPHNIKLKEFIFCKNIFNIFLPDEILFEIATYIDYKTLFCTLPSVNKQCEQFIKIFHTSFNIKQSIELDKPIYTELVILIMNNRQNKVPINVFHDPRFSHKWFKKILKKSVEQYLWDLSLILNQENGTVLVFSNTRTDEEFFEVLQACSLNTKYTPKEILNTKAEQLLISLKEKYNSIYDRVPNLNAFFAYYARNENEFNYMSNREFNYVFHRIDDFTYYFKTEAKCIIFFESLWNKIYTLLSNTEDKRAEHFYNRPAVLTILIELLYDNLNNQKITLKNIPSTFLEYARKIASPITAVPSKKLSGFHKQLKETFEKNITYQNYILFEDQEATQYSNSEDKEEWSIQTFYQNNEQVLPLEPLADTFIEISTDISDLKDSIKADFLCKEDSDHQELESQNHLYAKKVEKLNKSHSSKIYISYKMGAVFFLSLYFCYYKMYGYGLYKKNRFVCS